jgi:hypothetical protein
MYMYVCSITHAYNVGSRLFIRMWQLISLDLLKMVFVFIGVASVRLHIQRFSPLQLTLYCMYFLHYTTILYSTTLLVLVWMWQYDIICVCLSGPGKFPEHKLAACSGHPSCLPCMPGDLDYCIISLP